MGFLFFETHCREVPFTPTQVSVACVKKECTSIFFITRYIKFINVIIIKGLEKYIYKT